MTIPDIIILPADARPSVPHLVAQGVSAYFNGDPSLLGSPKPQDASSVSQTTPSSSLPQQPVLAQSVPKHPPLYPLQPAATSPSTAHRVILLRNSHQVLQFLLNQQRSLSTIMNIIQLRRSSSTQSPWISNLKALRCLSEIKPRCQGMFLLLSSQSDMLLQ